MRRLFRRRTNKYGRAKFLHNKFYFESELPVQVDIPESDLFVLKINEEESIGLVDLYPDDKVEITYDNNKLEDGSVDFVISTTDDDSEARVKKVIKNKTINGLMNIPEPKETLVLKIGEVKLPPDPIDIDEIKEFLLSRGLNGVFVEENIEKFALSEEEIELTLVTSKKPEPAKPARFELIEGLEDESKVRKNQFIARFVDETPGVPGYNVYGDEIQPRDISFFPEFGENVLIEDRGLMSLTNGRLVFTPYKIEVIEEEEIKKTINWEDGFVHYENDAVIDGDIKEGAQVKCNGNLTVKGGVFESYLFVDGHIKIEGNVDQSVVYSGFSKIAAKNIEEYSLQYLVIMERVMFESSFYADDGSNYLEKTKSLELASSEFTAIDQSVSPFISLVEQYGNTEVKELFEKFTKVVDEAKEITLNDQSSFEEVKEAMEMFYETINVSKELIRDSLGSLELGSANSSHLFSYEGTDVVGSGTYQTNIDSKGKVFVKGKCMSTNILAGTRVDIGEFRPGVNTDTLLRVHKSSGEIIVDKLSSDCYVQIGDEKVYIPDERVDVYFTQKDIRDFLKK